MDHLHPDLHVKNQTSVTPKDSFTMAQSHPDESDGIFLEDGVSPTPGDEADFALSVVNLTRSSDIPLRYFLPKIFSPMEASMTRSCQRISEKSPKYRLVRKLLILGVFDSLVGSILFLFVLFIL